MGAGLDEVSGDPGQAELDARSRELDRRAAELEERASRLGRETEAFHRDLNERLQAEKLKSLAALVAGLTHELNNPLAVISGFAELLLAQAEENGIREGLEAIYSEARRCTRIVHHLLSFARQRRAVSAAIDLNEIVTLVHDLLRYKLTLEDIEVTLKLDSRMRPVLGDHSQIQQVVLQLLVQAQRSCLAVDPSVRARRIVLETRERGDRAVLEVGDSGPGLAKDELSRVFDPFFEHGGAGHEGAGLGLSLCHGIVAEHGGQISVRSEEGAGSAFTVSLPIAGAAGVPAPTPPDIAARRKAAEGRGVLVADDDLEVVKVLTRVLSREGYIVGCAADGREALKLARSGAYDVIVADLWMPRLDGIGLFRALERELPELAKQVIFTTGDTFSPEADEFLGGVKNRHLRKPWANEAMAQLVADVARAAPLRAPRP